MKNDIFISYSRHDSDVVNEIVTLLEQEGYSVWIDRDGIESGEDFKRVILRAIKESEVILFFSSEHSNVSDWTAKEIGVAVKYKKHIIPIMLDDSNFNEAVEFDLINLDYIDYSKPTIRPAMREKLLKTLRNKLGPRSTDSERLEAERKAKEAAERERLEHERNDEEAKRKAEQDRHERERIEAERKETEAYAKCITVTACDNYLKTYPHGLYSNQVRAKKAELEQQTQQQVPMFSRPSTSGAPHTGSVNGHEFVDLGLPSGTLWATCNVGASKPEDDGDFFSWGEIRPKTEYDWKTYLYSKEKKRLFSKYTFLTKLTKYCNRSFYGYKGFSDELTVLQTSDDAATINWGDGWRMPILKQWKELVSNTENNWTKRSGVFGRLFTATNGASLFIPAAGYRYESGLGNAGSYGYYWSSSLHKDYPMSAWYFYIFSGNIGMSHYDRYRGHMVRAVCSKK